MGWKWGGVKQLSLSQALEILNQEKLLFQRVLSAEWSKNIHTRPEKALRTRSSWEKLLQLVEFSGIAINYEL